MEIVVGSIRMMATGFLAMVVLAGPSLALASDEKSYGKEAENLETAEHAGSDEHHGEGK